MNGARHSGRLPCRELAQDVQVPADDRGRGRELRFARRIELELARIDEDVRACELAHLLQLRGRPGRLNRPASPEDDDLADPGVSDGLDRRVSRQGRSRAAPSG